MSGGDGCQVRMPDGEVCGWTRDDKHLDCAAHRMRLRKRGDYLAHIPVTRKPSRRPEDVAARMAEAAQRLTEHREQRGGYRGTLRARRRVVAAMV